MDFSYRFHTVYVGRFSLEEVKILSVKKLKYLDLDESLCEDMASMLSRCNCAMENFTGTIERASDSSKAGQLSPDEVGPHLETTIRDVERVTSIFGKLRRWVSKDADIKKLFVESL